MLQSVWSETGANGRQLTSLRKFSGALAAAGDLKSALEMHPREPALADRLIAANRDTALAEWRTRFDREAQQRRILLLERGNALTAAAVRNQQFNQRLWANAGVLALAAMLMLLVHRVRETRRKLETNQASLRVQSARDALTGASSRHHAQALMRAASAEPGGFAGALLMIDSTTSSRSTTATALPWATACWPRWRAASPARCGRRTWSRAGAARSFWCMRPACWRLTPTPWCAGCC